MVGAWCFGCLSGPPGFTCWISFTALFTVEFLSLLYLLVIFWFICLRKWCIDKLGVFHANQISMCLYLCEVGAVNRFKPSSKIFYWPFQGGTSFVDLLWFCSVMCSYVFICALWSPAGKGLTSWFSFVVSNCEFVTFPFLYWVRCGTWLYRFLIFAPLLTFILKLMINRMILILKLNFPFLDRDVPRSPPMVCIFLSFIVLKEWALMLMTSKQKLIFNC